MADWHLMAADRMVVAEGISRWADRTAAVADRMAAAADRTATVADRTAAVADRMVAVAERMAAAVIVAEIASRARLRWLIINRGGLVRP